MLRYVYFINYVRLLGIRAVFCVYGFVVFNWKQISANAYVANTLMNVYKYSGDSLEIIVTCILSHDLNNTIKLYTVNFPFDIFFV